MVSLTRELKPSKVKAVEMEIKAVDTEEPGAKAEQVCFKARDGEIKSRIKPRIRSLNTIGRWNLMPDYKRSYKQVRESFGLKVREHLIKCWHPS